MSAIHLSNVSFSYSSAVPIVEGAVFDLGPGWAGLVGANGAGKSTLLSLIAGHMEPDNGSIKAVPAGLDPVLCAQRVDDPTPAIAEFAESWERYAVRLRARLELDPADLDRWETMSPGERKRWQIGAALASDPAVLLLDEPTNHLDAHARALLLHTLESFRGCGIIVSHDRDVLNSLTAKTIRLVGGRVELWNAPYNEAHDAWNAQAAEARERHDDMRRQQRRLERRIADQRRTSQQKDAERIRERRAAGKHDLDTRGSAASYKHERGQKTGAQTVKSMTSALDRISEDIDTAAFDKELGGAIDFPFEPSPKEFLVSYDGPVMAGGHHLFDVGLAVRRTDRIRLAGRNGAGKSSLLVTLLEASSAPADRLLHLPQEASAADGQRWLDTVRRLPNLDRGRVMSLVALLGSDPGPLLRSDLPSPGEARKLALALGLGTPHWLLALDEPTNHLDLPSIERLEAALSAYPGAVVLITHDDRLAASIVDETWHVGSSGVTVGGTAGDETVSRS